MGRRSPRAKVTRGRRRRPPCTAHVRLDLGGGNVVTASITNESVDDLKLQKGQSAYAVIKATSVMIATD